MKIVMTGATGFIGRALVDALLKEGHILALLTRFAPKPEAVTNAKLSYSVWNPAREGEIVKEVNGTDAVVNLAGEPILGKRWTESQKMQILQSRVDATKTLARSIEKAEARPKMLVNASAVGYYGARGADELSEASHAGEGFLSEVCRAWEAHAIRTEDFGVRVVRLRTGIVLDRSGGAIRVMSVPFRMFLGGWLGSGHQWLSWIHREDLVRLVIFCLGNDNLSGAVNAVSPQPVTNKVFSMVLAQVLHRPCLFPVPAFLLRLVLGEMADMLLSGQRVVPERATQQGFSFLYPDIRKALEAILRR